MRISDWSSDVCSSDLEAGEAVPGQENAGQQTRTAINAGTVGQNGQQDEEQKALEESLVELARVARHRATVGKDHRPRQVRGPTVKLTVDKVGDPSEEQPNGRGAGDQVAQDQDREASLSREQPSRADHAQQAAMERHAAAPDHEYLKRIGKVPVEVVEEDVAQPAAQDDAEGRPQNEVAQDRKSTRLNSSH